MLIAFDVLIVVMVGVLADPTELMVKLRDWFIVLELLAFDF